MSAQIANGWHCCEQPLQQKRGQRRLTKCGEEVAKKAIIEPSIGPVPQVQPE
jgi:hypothetical protein